MENCCAKVAHGSYGWRTRYEPCKRPGKIEREGKWWCGQHDPEAAAARRNKANNKWAEQRSADARRYLLTAAAPDLLALLIESQTSIGGDWRARRDAIIAKATGAETAQ